VSGGKRHKGQQGRSHWQSPRRRGSEIPLDAPLPKRQLSGHGDEGYDDAGSGLTVESDEQGVGDTPQGRGDLPRFVYRVGLARI